MKRIVMALIQGYQRYISPNLGSNCRFQPTCSQYTLEAVERYGAAKGLWLGAKRISRCHPFNPGGYDPVP
jgi:hypothetical protein